MKLHPSIYGPVIPSNLFYDPIHNDYRYLQNEPWPWGEGRNTGPALPEETDSDEDEMSEVGEGEDETEEEYLPQQYNCEEATEQPYGNNENEQEHGVLQETQENLENVRAGEPGCARQPWAQRGESTYMYQ